jgi:endonuclease/exonuclease/phosphatase family metal-dependent hydrolase
VLSWNLHYGVSSAGSVDLEAVARTIEAHDPDAVLLQEVSRGWVQGGGVDMATWLSNRLHRQFTFAPAADGRFGNVILSRRDARDVRIQPLPYGDGPQQRSALSAAVEVGQDRVRVTSIHLQNRRANTPTRLRQLETYLASIEADRPDTRAIIGGDLNAEPGSPEVALLTEAGFVSAIDAVGDPGALTSPATNPQRRIDWVFSRGVTVRSADVLADARSSDHLPIVIATSR